MKNPLTLPFLLKSTKNWKWSHTCFLLGTGRMLQASKQPTPYHNTQRMPDNDDDDDEGER